MTVSAVWTIADIFNGLMAIPNMIALFALSGVVAKEAKDFFKADFPAKGESAFLYTKTVGFVERHLFFLWEKCASMSESTRKNWRKC